MSNYYNEIVDDIARQEGKRSNAKVGDVREVMKLACKRLVTDPKFLAAAIRNGARLLKWKI